MSLSKKIVFLVLMAFLVGIIAGCGGNENAPVKNDQEATQNESGQSLFVYAGAGLNKPMNEIGKVFEEKYGVKINYTYAGSAQNLSQIELSNKGDLYVPGDLYYYEQAEEKGLVVSKKDVAYHIPAIAVPKGNPAGIEKLEDLGKPGVKVVLGDEKSAAIGKNCVKMFEKNGLTDAIAKNVVAKAATVNELVVYIAMKQADASIVWEDNVVGVDDIEMVSIPEEQNMIKTIPICLLKSSQQKELAQKFLDFVASAEGKAVFQKHGFKPVQ